MKIEALRSLPLTFGFLLIGLGTLACADDSGSEGGLEVGETFLETTGVGDGDGDTNEGSEAEVGGTEAEGDGDGDTAEGDGDGDTAEGDGDGDTAEGDGDGDTAEGDGDGDTAEGDGDGDTAEGEGDGDGDGETTTTGNNPNCQAPPSYVDCDGTPGNLTTNAFQAMGINCGDDPTNTVVAANAVMNSINNNAWRVITGFGTAAGSNYNNRLWAASQEEVWINPDDEEIPSNTSTAILILSTGVVAAPNAQGVVIENSGSQSGNGNNGNLDAGGLPAPLTAQRGSNNGAGGTPFMNCDLVNDCSDSLYVHWIVNGWNNPNDKLWMQMDLTVPVGTEGYVFDFAYFSSEFPTYYNTQFNDLFIAWSTSESYTGNITFVNDAPLTITSLENAGAFQHKGNDPALAGTGFEGHAGTGWFVARGSAVPEETFQVTFFIADMADSILATAVLLDNFRWECAGCIPNEVNSCGVTPLPQ